MGATSTVKGGDLCDVAQVEEACQWLQNVEPKGRADVQPLLASIQSLPSEPDRQLCIFLLAAGHVGNEPSILKSLDFDQSDRRYYAVGLGPAVQQAFLRRLALLTRGRCEVAPDGNCAEALKRLLGQTRALLAEVTFEGQEGNDAEVDMSSLVPSRMTSLTAEGPVHCMGIGTPDSLRFRSKDETGVFFAGTVNARNTSNPALEGVWAGLRVREMIDSVRLSAGAKRKQLRAEAAALASQHGILVEDTVLVLESEGGLDVQLSVLPYRWRKVAQQIVKADEEAAPAFDWRKGLKARDGLFKGGRMPGAEGEGEGVRHGLRSRGGGAEMPGKPSAKAGKPMLDRYSMSASTSSMEEEAVASDEEIVSEVFPSNEVESESQEQVPEESQEIAEESVAEVAVEAEAEVEAADEPVLSIDEPSQPEPAEPEPSPPVAPVPVEPVTEAAVAPFAEPVVEAADTKPESAPPAPAVAVAIPTLSVPVVSFTRDPLSEAKLRMESYLEQTESVESRLALSALAGMPPEVATGGPELPRILAQTVGHLEKRGYYSAAVSVLGMILRDHPSSEATKKMESLLIAWATSLSDEQLPEALHILGLGGRICPGSESLAEASQKLGERWSAVAQERHQIPVVSNWIRMNPPEQPIPSPAQIELLELRQKQEALTAEVTSLRSSLEEKLSALPQLFERLLESRPVAAAPLAPQPAAVTPAAQSPTVASPDPELAPLPDLPLPEPDAGVITVDPIAVSIPLTPELLEPVGLLAEEPVPVLIPLPGESLEVEPQPIPIPDPVVTPAEPEKTEPEPEEDSGEGLNLTKDELLELLQAEPKDESGHRALKTAFPDAKDRINFYRDLVRIDPDQPGHSLSLARAYKDADQTKVAVVHYQKYLRSEKDRAVYLELADAYDELGKSNLSVSARKAAELLN